MHKFNILHLTDTSSFSMPLSIHLHLVVYTLLTVSDIPKSAGEESRRL